MADSESGVWSSAEEATGLSVAAVQNDESSGEGAGGYESEASEVLQPAAAADAEQVPVDADVEIADGWDSASSREQPPRVPRRRGRPRKHRDEAAAGAAEVVLRQPNAVPDLHGFSRSCTQCLLLNGSVALDEGSLKHCILELRRLLDTEAESDDYSESDSGMALRYIFEHRLSAGVVLRTSTWVAEAAAAGISTEGQGWRAYKARYFELAEVLWLSARVFWHAFAARVKREIAAGRCKGVLLCFSGQSDEASSSRLRLDFETEKPGGALAVGGAGVSKRKRPSYQQVAKVVQSQGPAQQPPPRPPPPQPAQHMDPVGRGRRDLA
jgi:hypothetical protein